MSADKVQNKKDYPERKYKLIVTFARTQLNAEGRVEFYSRRERLQKFFKEFSWRNLPKEINGWTNCDHCGTEIPFSYIKEKPPYRGMCFFCRTGFEVHLGWH